MPTRQRANLTMTQADFGVHVMGVLALELAGGNAPALPALRQVQAGELVELMARDLGKLVPGATSLELSVAAAHFDPAEVLRPGWPLHRRLNELRRRAPGSGQGPRVIAFGADADGTVPQPFMAEGDLQGAGMRVLPILLSGEAEAVHALRGEFEDVLLDRGMAGADTALFAQQAFGAQVEHARYLTVHDLAAIMSMQYGNQGLERLWPIIETALLSPAAEEWLDAPPEPLLRYAEGEARIALLDPSAWLRRHPDLATADAGRRERAYNDFLARQRQFAAVLEAHGVPVLFAHCAAGEDLRESLHN